jgi:RHS repeat-associated protein
VLEEGVGGDVAARYVWSPVYVDALVLRDRDTDADGTPDDERLWATQDANWNVTAVVDGSGAVAERYAYDPFGRATVLDANWATDGDGVSDVGWVYLHQGGRLDDVTRNYCFRNRDYSPTLGRWTSLDPIHFSSGDRSLYVFNRNNPTGLVDPLGLAALSSAQWDTLVKKCVPAVGDPTEAVSGNYFENAVLRLLGKPKYRGNRFTSTARMANGNVGSVTPDAVGDAIFIPAPGPLPGRPRTLVDGFFVDAKRVNGTITLSDTNYEALGYADVLGRLGRLSGQLRPMMLYVATTDTLFSAALIRDFDLNLVVLSRAGVEADECQCEVWLTDATVMNVRKFGSPGYVTPKNKMKLDAALIANHP